MKIIADENIPLVDRFFGEIGDVETYPGREITSEHVKNADALLVRSVTKVDEVLLAGSSVRFVGTCTIGEDHIDRTYLEQHKIQFASAPGSNANSVVEYVLSCLSILTETHNLDLDLITVGIIGYGNVGSLLAKRLRKMGVEVKACDPFLDQDELNLVSHEEALACDVVSLHVPLSDSGDYPTKYLIDETVLANMGEDQVLINTCRGAVINNQALYEKISRHERFTAILDVWENEPNIDVALAKKVFIGTPHIAGYSFDGKVSGTEMIYRALCQSMGLPTRHKAAQFLEEPPLSKMAFTSMADVDWCIHTAIRACFDVRHDDSQLRITLNLPEEDRLLAFDRLRKEYRCRREFSGVKVQLKKVDSELHTKFKALGFNIKI